MNAVAKVEQSKALTIEQVLIGGDLGKLTPEQRVEYYNSVCGSVGLNPLTQPFAYINLNGKLTLYALRGATDQLRQIHNISVEDMTEVERDGVCIVTVKVRNAAGRTDISKGAVHLGTLKGEALANAIMKAETKAKRRATLSICGLALLDELEVETIPNARPEPAVKLTPPPAPRTEPTDAEIRQMDRDTMRDMRGETPENWGGPQRIDETPDHDPETGEIDVPVGYTEAEQKAVDWARKMSVTVKAIRDGAAYDALCTPKFRDALKRLGDIDAKAHEALTQALSDALDRINPIAC